MSKEAVNSIKSGQYSWYNDYAMLFKHKLTMFVVFSAMMSYLASIEGHVNWISFALLFVGGFCITAAANALNEVLEKDYDKLMTRTADRPLAAGRMTVSHAVFVAGVLWVVGMICLAYFNALSSLLGALAVVSYAFVYTPLKRYSPIAVLVGAFPGAIPLLIGNVAAVGHIDQMGIFLFAVQFIWQFPHFWAIGWLGFDEYKLAGYKLIGSKDGERDPNTGIHAAIYACLFIPIGFFGYYAQLIGVNALILMIVSAIGFSYFGYRLYKVGTRKSALHLMFASLVYLAIALGVVYIDKLF